ncbi:hypothetical protein BKA65DRAFT_600543 [Rhexocercosporidium sp. MPI-PUGE-AT-0058]|nr:hypothetical protein BKA65DRAFT_600543 [Rhexocercosporidium sp. MPI-PUGE-AT-0058]
MARLYIEELKKLEEIVQIMKLEYNFHGSVNQYKRQFGIWKIKRAITTKQKVKISKAMETRAKQGKSSIVLHNGQVESRKIWRFMKERARENLSMWAGTGNQSFDIGDLSGHALQCGNKVFLNWSMPAGILRFLKTKATSAISPSTSVLSPMSGIQVTTPFSNSGRSPQCPSTPHNVSSPSEGSALSTIVQESVKISRASLFVQRSHKELLRGMNLQEQCITTEWMHQLWQYSYRTARTWGHGPRHWNASNLKFNHFSRVYQRIKSPEPPPDHTDQVDPDDEAAWKPWVGVGGIQEFAKSLQNTLETNEFSTVEVKDLPISASQIVRAVKRSPEQLLEEAFGFSTMAGNKVLVCDMLERLENNEELVLHDLYPLHLASSYLSGAKNCCEIFDDIIQTMATGENSVRKLYTNHLNHTVLDNLMITILKAHTSCTRSMVDDAFKKELRFAGEEVDICGRWEADSDCIRHLQSGGSPTIPQSWKHMFCHTSVQAITHCVGALFSPHWRPEINTPSGLFIRRCLNETCGRKLQLLPLHTLVITAVYLAQLGRDGENLFGMVACLLTSNIVISELDPLELARSVPEGIISGWPTDRLVGWKLFCIVLQLSQNQWNPRSIPPPHEMIVQDHNSLYSHDIFMDDEDVYHSRTIFPSTPDDIEYETTTGNQNLELGDNEDEEESDEESEEESDEEGDGVPGYCSLHWDTGFQRNYFGKNKSVATLWASIQTELLTYRRLADGDSWISPNFDMLSVLRSSENGENLSIPLVAKGMMEPFCRCGDFEASDDNVCPRVEEACKEYFSNLEDYSRSTFLSTPQDRMEYWEGNC